MFLTPEWWPSGTESRITSTRLSREVPCSCRRARLLSICRERENRPASSLHDRWSRTSADTVTHNRKEAAMNKRIVALVAALFVAVFAYSQGLYWESSTSGGALGDRVIAAQNHYMPHM